MHDKQTMAVQRDFYNHEPITGAHAVITAEYGIEGGKMQTTQPTVVTHGKNIGRANHTNVWTQALRDAVGLYNRHIKTKITEQAEHIQPIAKPNAPVASTTRYPPMLAKNFRRVIVHKRRHEYELVREPGCVDVDWTRTVYAQPKLDGIRSIAHWTPGGVEFYSRNLGVYDYPHLSAEMTALFERDQVVYIDGEFYKHGVSLQQLSGDARKKDGSASTRGEFHVYDCFYPDRTMTFVERQATLDALLTPAFLTASPHIFRVETVQVRDIAALTGYLEATLAKRYEGVMLRTGSGAYKCGFGDARSDDLLKVKPRFTDEYEITGFTQGIKGKDAGAIIWQLRTAQGAAFTAVPKGMTYEERYELFRRLTADPEIFRTRYLGQPMTVEYEDKSEAGVPLRPKAIVVRDYE